MERDALDTVKAIELPDRYGFASVSDGLEIRKLCEKRAVIGATFEPFRSRGPTCRRVLATLEDGRRIVVEFGNFDKRYDKVEGTLRGRHAQISDGTLLLEKPRYRHFDGDMLDPVAAYGVVHDAWARGIHYRGQMLDENGDEVRSGLRQPQLGALHAVASRWTLSSEPSSVILPTGTGKTEVMIAAAVDSHCDRLLVVVPTDALRRQTADKFASYGKLVSLGVVDSDLALPMVGALSTRPSYDHFERLKQCNVVVTTMSSIGLAPEEVQRDFAGLFSHIFFDEAHHIQAATWNRFKKHCEEAKTLLLTATPFREDGRPLEGKIIYNFPLSAAQEQDFFKKIRFRDVFEPNEDVSDQAIAEAAVDQLRADLEQGYDHILMARARTVDKAEQLFEEIYERNYADLNPVLVHSRMGKPTRDAALERIRRLEHNIVVCVNMFGEGFDLPNLKVAALHNVHKSLGITLQFIGRFARDARNVGEATFVANTAEDGVPEALESLYQEDADWNTLLADLSYDAIDPQAQLSELVDQLEELEQSEQYVEISTLALRPKISAQVFRVDDFHPDLYEKAFSSRQRVFQSHLSRQDNFLVLVVNQEEAIDWTDSRDIAIDTWDLYIAYYDPNRRLLFIHSSNKGSGVAKLAKAVANNPGIIKDEDVFKTLNGLHRITLHNVGLSSRSRNVRYQMFAGLDVRDAIDPVQQQSKLKSNITAIGYEEGARHSVGCSRKGKIWSLRSGSLADWRTWCNRIGEKLIQDTPQNDFLRHTLIPRAIDTLPDCEALMADWPDQLFETANFRFEIQDGNDSYEFADCQIDLRNWNANGREFVFALTAGEDLEGVLRLRIFSTGLEGQESDYAVDFVSGKNPQVSTAGQTLTLEEYFRNNPPLVRLEDGSQLAGNILLTPQEQLGDTYERDLIHTLDWTSCDILKESRWKGGAVREDSVQAHFIGYLRKTTATFIIDDDDTGEAADIIAIEEEDERIVVYLWHCKYSSGDTPGHRAHDLYEVCGQAQKSTKWTWSLRRLVEHIRRRETRHNRGRDTRFMKGTLAELIALRKGARRKYVDYKIGIVQPGLSKANIPAEHLAVLGATNTFIQCTTNFRLSVFASD